MTLLAAIGLVVCFVASVYLIFAGSAVALSLRCWGGAKITDYFYPIGLAGCGVTLFVFFLHGLRSFPV